MGEGTVIITLRIVPDGPGALAGLKKELGKLKVIQMGEEPIGFGVSALLVKLTIPDRSGEQDRLEETVGQLKGVGSFEILNATRAM